VRGANRRALESLSAEWNAERKAFALTPWKDWASHGAGSVRYLAMGLRPPSLSTPRMTVPPVQYGFAIPPRRVVGPGPGLEWR
jgi:hypothetical protein